MQAPGKTLDRQASLAECNHDYIKKYVMHSPPPIRKGEFLSVNIDDMVHNLGVKEHENSLIARVLLKPKVVPMSHAALRTSINQIWDVPGNWKFLPWERATIVST